MPSHVWTGRKPLHRTWDDDVHAGEEFDATDAELRAFGDNIDEVVPPDDADDAGDERDAEDEPDGSDEEADDSTSDDEGDADESTEAFDAEEWFDDDYRDRAAAVEAGDVDDHLETIYDIETSETVIEAVDARLEG